HCYSIAERERINQDLNKNLCLLNAWTPDNTNTQMPRAILPDPNQNNRPSTRWLEDGSFIRLKNVRLGYNLPSPACEKLRMSNAQVYASAVNVFTITDYTGYDPELGNLNQSPELGNLDAGQYPQSRQYVIG